MITFKTHSSRSNHHGWKAFILLAVLLISRMDAFVPLRQHQSKPTSPVSQQFLQQQSSSYDYDDTDRLIQIGRTHFASAFAFPLDDWQAHAGGAISETYNVIVCAPTGAGKTVVGEMALLHAHHQNKTSIYTTPLKALSNQKYTDLLGRFSVVGLSTGDMSINKGASVTVMTTEVSFSTSMR
jgi:superfamily II RNA helicase